MVIYGLDFTCTPSDRKPIQCAEAELANDTLTVLTTVRITSFAEFERFLQRPGPWRAGFDFPFGQPRRLLENLQISGDWAECVAQLTKGERKDFENLLNSYRKSRPKGDKQHLRKTDELAGSCSPMMLYGTPVAKMYFEGAPRLLKAGLSILPVHPRADSRIAVETYPKLVANRYSGGAKYKTERRREQTGGMTRTRAAILDGLEQHAIEDYGFRVKVAKAVREAAISDPTGDILDAVLCSVQAAWSAQQSNPPNGIPKDCDRVEGWIVDPILLQYSTR